MAALADLTWLLRQKQEGVLLAFIFSLAVLFNGNGCLMRLPLRTADGPTGQLDLDYITDSIIACGRPWKNRTAKVRRAIIAVA